MTLTAEDRIEICECLYKYARVTDHWTGSEADVRAILEVFTEDAVFDGPSGHYEGHAEIGDWVRKMGAIRKMPRRHVISNPIITGAGNEAELIAYITVVRTRSGAKKAWTDEVGTYTIRARKEAGVWRLSYRRCAPENVVD